MRNQLGVFALALGLGLGVNSSAEDSLPRQLVDALMKSKVPRSEEKVTHPYKLRESSLVPPTQGAVTEDVYTWVMSDTTVVYSSGIRNEKVAIPPRLRLTTGKPTLEYDYLDVDLDGLNERKYDITGHGFATFDGKTYNNDPYSLDRVFKFSGFQLAGPEVKFFPDGDVKKANHKYNEQLKRTLDSVQHQGRR